MSKLDDIKKLQRLIEIEFEVNNFDLFFSHDKNAIYARKIFCHTALSMNVTSNAASCATPVSSHFILNYYEMAMKQIKVDAIFVKHLNVIREKMGMDLLQMPKVKLPDLPTPKKTNKKTNKEKPKEPIVTKIEDKKIPKPNPFGIDYTPLDELRYREAIRSSRAFMQTFGKGLQPLKEGHPLSRRSE